VAPWDKTVVARDFRAVLDTLEGGKSVPDSFECNGNTFVPEQYFNLTVTTPAGIIHDWDYNVGGMWQEFRAANARYYRNLRALGFRSPFAWLRWAAVSSVGAMHFNWER